MEEVKELKRVSFEVAEAIAKLGYPQGDSNSGNCAVYPLEYHDDNFSPYTRIGKLSSRYHCETWRVTTTIPYVVAPFYVEVWFWLWRVKRIEFAPTHNSIEYAPQDDSIWMRAVDVPELSEKTDPEDAIECVVKYLVDNNLIK